MVGDRAKDVIVHLHYIMSSVDIKQNKSVLWAYKKDLLGFTRHAFRYLCYMSHANSRSLVIGKSERIRSRKRSSAAFVSQILKTLSNYSWLFIIFAMSITKRRRKYSEIPSVCVSCKILKPLLQIY